VLLQAALDLGAPASGTATQDQPAAAVLPPWPPEGQSPELPPAPPGTNPAEMKPSPTEQLGFSLLGTPVDRPQPQEHPIGGYLLAFEIISIHLVVVLVGAAYLARAKRRVHRQPIHTEPY